MALAQYDVAADSLPLKVFSDTIDLAGTGVANQMGSGRW